MSDTLLGILVWGPVFFATPLYMIGFMARRYWVNTYRNYRNHDTGNPFERTPSTVSQVRSVDKMIQNRYYLKTMVVDGCNSRNEAAPIPVQKMWPDPPVQWTAAPDAAVGPPPTGSRPTPGLASAPPHPAASHVAPEPPPVSWTTSPPQLDRVSARTRPSPGRAARRTRAPARVVDRISAQLDGVSART